MALSELLELVKKKDLDGFEARCLELLDNGTVQFSDVARAFDQLDRDHETKRFATLGQMVVENPAAAQAPRDALRIARLALLADPDNQTLRKHLVGFYRNVYGEHNAFDALLDASGLEAGAKPHRACRTLDLCLTVKPGDPLLSRTEEEVAEVVEVEAGHGLFTLKRDGRSQTVAPAEVAREYERADPDDFRVLRIINPDRLKQLLADDPVAVVIGMLQAHGGMADQDELKRELVPRYLASKDWSKWWTKARGKLKRSANVIMEGRSPVILTYSERGRTLEDEVWDNFQNQTEPEQWLSTTQKYIREKRSHNEEPDAELLQRVHTWLREYIQKIGDKRPSEAFACALVFAKVDAETGALGDDAQRFAVDMLRNVDDPIQLIGTLPNTALWDLALDALPKAREDDTGLKSAELIPIAPASMLDRLVAMARERGFEELVQSHVDTALANPVDYPEMVYWLWKGPKKGGGVNVPERAVLFTTLIETLVGLGRTIIAEDYKLRDFRARARSALSAQSYKHAQAVIEATDDHRAVTLRTQLEQLAREGDLMPRKLLALLREAHPQLWVKPIERVEPWNDPDVSLNTVAGIKRKTDERDHLVNVTMRENARKIGEAASHGDLSENSEYKFALEERDLLRARMAQMNHDLSIAEAIQFRDVPTDHVGIGSRAILRDAGTGEEHPVTFLGPFDADMDLGIYNYRAPISQKILGLHEGDRVRVALAGGDEKDYEIARIEVGLQRDEAGDAHFVPAVTPSDTPG